MEPYDWSKFTLRIPINADAKAIYNAWSTPGNLEKWFLRQADFWDTKNQPLGKNIALQTGDRYEWRWYGWGNDMFETGTVLQSNGEDFFQFQFGNAGIVSITTSMEHGETIMELIQERIPTDEESKVRYHIGCGNGWTFYLANLKSILEGGHDLRNKNDAIKNVVNS